MKRHSLRTHPDKHCRLLAYGYSYPHGLEKYHLEFYENHNFSVRRFFRKHNAEHLLLEISWDSGDGWEELCHFLHEPVPSLPLPHENKGSRQIPAEIERENQLRIDQQLGLLFRECL